jgi:hypothetical protein
MIVFCSADLCVIDIRQHVAALTYLPQSLNLQNLLSIPFLFNRFTQTAGSNEKRKAGGACGVGSVGELRISLKNRDGVQGRDSIYIS